MTNSHGFPRHNSHGMGNAKKECDSHGLINKGPWDYRFALPLFGSIFPRRPMGTKIMNTEIKTDKARMNQKI
jgi:hypothetical protein